MHVGHHDVLDRKLGRLAYGGAQSLAVGQASAWVDYGDCVVPDDKADVGYAIFVVGCHVLIDASSDVNSRRNLLSNQRLRLFRACLRERADAAGTRSD
jgi:hypothetical protein